MENKYKKLLCDIVTDGSYLNDGNKLIVEGVNKSTKHNSYQRLDCTSFIRFVQILRAKKYVETNDGLNKLLL